MATTWETKGTGAYGAARLRKVEPEVIRLVDQFINAYLEQNPKQ